MIGSNFFNFYPVGHGLFYTGSIDHGNFNFVYDCGTESSVKIDSFVNHFRAFINKDELNYAVLSHLHTDHFSGMQKLLSVFKVKKLYLPFIGHTWNVRAAILSIVILYSRDEEPDEEYILTHLEIAKSIYDNDNLVYVSDNNQDTNFSHIVSRNNNWIFEFFIKHFPLKKINALNIALNAYLTTNSFSSVEDVILAGKIKDLRSIYEGIFGKGNQLNKTSICLLHYPEDSNRIIYRFPVVGLKNCFYKSEGVTFLTGDSMITKGMLKSMNIKKNIDVLQAPHHGSIKNWKNVSSLIFTNVVVPCSNLRRYRLPSKSFIKSIPHNKYNECNESVGFPYIIE